MITLLFVLLMALSIESGPAAAVGVTSGAFVRVDAHWQLVCGRSYIRQKVVVVNKSKKRLCIRRGICNQNKLLSIVGSDGSRVVYGYSCGRPLSQPFTVADHLNSLEQLAPNRRRSYDFAMRAVTYPDDDNDPREFNMSPNLTYRGATSVEVTDCDAAASVCPSGRCSWEAFAASGVSSIVNIQDVEIPFAGASCPKGFDPSRDVPVTVDDLAPIRQR